LTCGRLPDHSAPTPGINSRRPLLLPTVHVIKYHQVRYRVLVAGPIKLYCSSHMPPLINRCASTPSCQQHIPTLMATAACLPIDTSALLDICAPHVQLCWQLPPQQLPQHVRSTTCRHRTNLSPHNHKTAVESHTAAGAVLLHCLLDTRTPTTLSTLHCISSLLLCRRGGVQQLDGTTPMGSAGSPVL
jgi:hypothetical protein